MVERIERDGRKEGRIEGGKERERERFDVIRKLSKSCRGGCFYRTEDYSRYTLQCREVFTK